MAKTEKKIGFLGAGNMGKAIIGGLIQAEVIAPKNIYIFDANKEVAYLAAEENKGIEVLTSGDALAKKCDVVILAVKPNIYPIVIDDIKASVDRSTLIVTIAAGITIERCEGLFKTPVRLIRTMPNTPALVGEGMSAYCLNEMADEKDKEMVQTIFSGFGKAIEIKESLMNPFTATAGSGPAWVFMFIESLADAAVLEGLPRKEAYTIAAQTVLGSAKMVLETGLHPALLKDNVCSPGGTTIEGVASLEAGGFRSCVIDAVQAASHKAELLG